MEKVISGHNLWLKDKAFDVFFFQLSGLAVLLMLVPYLIAGPSAVFPVYNFYLIFFGLPHNYLTWATIFPPSSRKSFKIEPIYTSIIVCAVLCLMLPMTAGTEFNSWILSFISYYSLWHAYRQHHGICKVYDAIQAKRTGDTTIFEDRKALNLFFGFAVNAVVVWAFTRKEIRYLLSADEGFDFIHPQIPQNIYYLYLAFTAVVGVWALKRCVYDRVRLGKFIPWPQLILMVIAISTYIVPYFFIPLEAMPLAIAIATSYHNIQYFGFVWLFERYRAEELSKTDLPLQLPQRLALQGSWKSYFGLAFLYSAVVIVFYLVTPRYVGLTFIYFLAIAHYIVDGYIWRRDVNQLMAPVAGRIAFATPR